MFISHKKIQPAVHILMPAYNCSQFIKNSLESVFCQNYKNFTLLIFNDGSTDSSMSVIETYLKANPENCNKIFIQHSQINLGVAKTRKELLKKSRSLNPLAYIFWLDADDRFSENNAIHLVIEQMTKTQANICLFNFSIEYEEPSLKYNAVQLVADQTHNQRVLEIICNSTTGYVSPLEVDLTHITSLGWTKCYAPSAMLPDSADCPYEDFVSIAALLLSQSITAITPQKPLITYLRRNSSICNKRTGDNFVIHIPTQLRCFFEAVWEGTRNQQCQLEKLRKAEQFVLYKLQQYEKTLTSLIALQANTDFDETTLLDYTTVIEKLKIMIHEIIESCKSSISPDSTI